MSTNRPTQGKNIAAFNIMSSSATGGYLDALHSGFTGSIDITNFHEDLNPVIDKVPFQGPFTERWVGGRQHRHQEIVTGSVNPLQRPESIKVVPGSNQLRVYGADHPSLHQARAVLYRETVAKRPLNIANIQYGTGSQSIGNFRHNYEVVQTSGRTANPRHFVESNSSYQAFPETMTHEGNVINSELNDTGSLRSFTLPSRTKHKSVIAERFSAPGDRYTMSRGFLNTSGEEMSVYNAMPFRNLPNRTTLRDQLTRHMKQGGYESGSATIPSIHKVPRNTKRTPVVVNGSETTRQIHDNYFVQHPIPQTDLQYAWITQSVGTIASTASVLYGYQPSADALNIFTASPRYLQNPVLSSSISISPAAGEVNTVSSTGTGLRENFLLPSGQSESDYYGYSSAMDIHAGRRCFLVGAYGDDTNATSAGAVYLHEETAPGSGIFSEKKITPTGAQAYENFGKKLDLCYRGENIYFIVSATGYDGSYSQQGRVLLFHSSSAGLSQVNVTSSTVPGGGAFGPFTNQYFGRAVAIKSGSSGI